MDNYPHAGAEDLRALAVQWRRRAAETDLVSYRTMMLRMAADLERLADETATKPDSAMPVG